MIERLEFSEIFIIFISNIIYNISLDSSKFYEYRHGWKIVVVE